MASISLASSLLETLRAEADERAALKQRISELEDKLMTLTRAPPVQRSPPPTDNLPGNKTKDTMNFIFTQLRANWTPLFAMMRTSYLQRPENFTMKTEHTSTYDDVPHYTLLWKTNILVWSNETHKNEWKQVEYCFHIYYIMEGSRPIFKSISGLDANRRPTTIATFS